ncbi:hypothetical protein OGAPHI_002092 [Ogataea philodendri]|uniref:Uncharacterized protein n=1 Tax=Ogataea philodendri TaxID=1378263 RepID=A0A9P8PA09_9ASCO|nr:uncharacterized protein OGAPHI_002092 [Ogataea philodendri]KAH3668338.1 hypothetical protein OGAPHI_002092 [Ogataea philodendri]
MSQRNLAATDPADAKVSSDSSSGDQSNSGNTSVPVSSTSSPGSVNNLALNLSSNDLEGMDSDVEKLLELLNVTEMKLDLKESIPSSELQLLLQLVRQTVLRINLNKNLAKYQLRNNIEEYATERQLLMKNLANVEKNLRILQNENEIINMKNLKLIKSLKTIKHDKVKTLKAENALLRKQIQDHSGRSPTILDALGRVASHVLQEEGE